MKLPSLHVGTQLKLGKANRGISFSSVGNKVHLHGTGTNTELYIDPTAQMRANWGAVKKSCRTVTDAEADTGDEDYVMTVAEMLANNAFTCAVAGTGRELQLPAAADWVSGISNLAVGDQLGPWYASTTAAAAATTYVLTLSGSGGTGAAGCSLAATPGTKPTIEFYIVFTNVTAASEAYTIYTDLTA